MLKNDSGFCLFFCFHTLHYIHSTARRFTLSDGLDRRSIRFEGFESPAQLITQFCLSLGRIIRWCYPRIALAKLQWKLKSEKLRMAGILQHTPQTQAVVHVHVHVRVCVCMRFYKKNKFVGPWSFFLGRVPLVGYIPIVSFCSYQKESALPMVTLGGFGRPIWWLTCL